MLSGKCGGINCPLSSAVVWRSSCLRRVAWAVIVVVVLLVGNCLLNTSCHRRVTKRARSNGDVLCAAVHSVMELSFGAKRGKNAAIRHRLSCSLLRIDCDACVAVGQCVFIHFTSKCSIAFLSVTARAVRPVLCTAGATYLMWWTVPVRSIRKVFQINVSPSSDRNYIWTRHSHPSCIQSAFQYLATRVKTNFKKYELFHSSTFELYKSSTAFAHAHTHRHTHRHTQTHTHTHRYTDTHTQTHPHTIRNTFFPQTRLNITLIRKPSVYLLHVGNKTL